MDIGKIEKIERREIAPRRIYVPNWPKPQEKPTAIPAPNWPVREPVTVPAKGG